MKRIVLLDTNLMISALDPVAKSEDKAIAIKKIEELLKDSNVALAITPLIRYEVLRGVDWSNDVRYQSLLHSLNEFEEFDITRTVSEMAANLYRYDVEQSSATGVNRNFEKRKFDIFHFCSAKINQFEFVSEDTDIAKIHELHEAMLQSVVI
jgi:predicted nucleic acid-binding protein